MDVVMFKVMHRPDISNPNLWEWLSYVYNQELEEIESRLRRLKARGLLEDVNMDSQTIRVHDLYREFAKLESQGKLDKSADLGKRRWVWCEDASPAELEVTPFHHCWQNLTRICIKDEPSFSWHDPQTLQGIEWRYCSNVVVLKLNGLKKLRGDLNLAALKCLRSLELVDITTLNSLHGLQDLKNLTYFRWVQYFNTISPEAYTRIGKLPLSLKVLQLCVGAWLKPDAFDQCTNLSKLELYNCRADNLDLSNCLSLQSVMLCSLQWLKTLTGLSATPVSSLRVSCCSELVEIPGLSQLLGLKELHLYGNGSFIQLPNLEKLVRLQDLYIHEMRLTGGLRCLSQLRKLRYRDLSTKIPNLSGCEQLQAVDFSDCSDLLSLDGVFAGVFPALRSLNLKYCTSLDRLPDLSGLRSLEDLDLQCSRIKLREVDICMLAALPLLRPVKVGCCIM